VKHLRGGLFLLLVPGLVVLSAGSAAAASRLRWSSGRAPSAGNLIEVACPARTLCVAVNNAGGLVVSRDPAGGARTWKVVGGRSVLQLGGTLAQQNADAEVYLSAFDLSCPSVHLCVVGRPGAEARPGDDPGIPPIASVVYTTDPAGGPSAWHTVDGIDHNEGQIVSLTCRTVGRCYALEDVSGSQGQISAISVTTTRPTGPASGWRRTGTIEDDVGDLMGYTAGIACPSVSLCVAGTGVGLYATTNPAFGARALSWKFGVRNPVAEYEYQQFDGVTCPSKHLCVAEPDLTGCPPCAGDDQLVSTNPAQGLWRRAGVAAGAMTCPTSTFCVGTGAGAGTGRAADQLVSSTDPAGPARAWHVSRLSGDPTLRGIACASASFCVAVGDRGAIAVGSAPP